MIEDPALREKILKDKDTPLHSVVVPMVRESQGVVSSDVGM